MKLKSNRAARPVFLAGTVGLLAFCVVLAVSGVSPARAADGDDADSGDSNNGIMDQLGASIGSGVGSMKNMFGLGKPPAPPIAESPSGCPTIVILDGTGAQRVTANADAGNAGVKYQYSILDVARECRVVNNQMVVKVGVNGRVLLGPAGAPGAFDVPIRIAIVDERDQKPALSKLYKVSASIPAGQTSTPYTLVADSLTLSLTSGARGVDYSIKVGIDGSGKGDGAAPARHRKHKPVAAAAATQ